MKRKIKGIDSENGHFLRDQVTVKIHSHVTGMLDAGVKVC